MTNTKSTYAVGIDLGTTSLSAQVIDLTRGESVEAISYEHNAALSLAESPDAFACDAETLCQQAKRLFETIIKKYGQVVSLGVTGQMHGIVCLDKNNGILSPLYTWQNGFGERTGATGETFCQEITALTGERIPTGYGIVTYYALDKMGLLPEKTARIATIADLVASRLTQSPLVSHPTHMASLGVYDLKKKRLKHSIIKGLQIPAELFPPLCEDHAVAGRYEKEGVSIPVASAIGDNQASLYATLAHDGMVLVNVGTGSQISLITDRAPNGCEVRPYFDGKVLTVGSALCGGRAYAALCDFVSGILSAFAAKVSREDVYHFLNEAAKKGKDSDLSVSTCFSGTREDASLRGGVFNLSLSNFRIHDLAAGVLKGIVAELFAMYQVMNPEGKRYTPVVSGNAMRKNALLRDFCKDCFEKEPLLPLVREEAAYGAALYGAVASGMIAKEELGRYIQYETNGGSL